MRKNNKLVRILITSLCLSHFFINISFAGIDSLMKHAMPRDSMSNINSPAVSRDQAGGYMTGGSMLLRGPKPKELNPLQIQTPKLKFDACTGSGDFRFGALSYISGAEFSSFMKSVARASGAYLLKMSIKSACPQCEDIMTYLETVARDINGLSMNQCSLAQSIAGGAFSKLTAGEKQHCMMEANASGSNKDMFDTTRKCQDSAGDRGRNSSGEFESMLGDEFNLVWKALSKGTGADSKLKELMMSISGTIIGQKSEGRFKFQSKPSLLQDKELLDKYIGTSSSSSNIKLYVCDKVDQCLHPIEEVTSLPQSETLYGNVTKIMKSLVEKVQNDKSGISPKLSDEEEALIQFSSIPILRLIEMELAAKADPGNIIVRVGEFVEVVCYDVITNFMQVMLNRVATNVQALEHAQADNVVIRNFIQEVESLRRYLSDAKFGAFQKLQVITQVKQRLNQQSQVFETSIGQIMEQMEN